MAADQAGTQIRRGWQSGQDQGAQRQHADPVGTVHEAGAVYAGYRNRLFPDGVPVAMVEAGISWPWRALVGPLGLALGIDRFGASAPADELARQFGFTEESVTERIRDWLR